MQHIYLTTEKMLSALNELDTLLMSPLRLIVGGGGAMLLAHHFPFSTMDIDAVPAKGGDLVELDMLVKKVAEKLNIQHDWLNPYYATFTHVLPSDYGNRLIRVLSGKQLLVDALSLDDLLIMKCFAARQKDRIHARELIRKGANIPFVELHINELLKKNIPHAERALDFLDEVLPE